MGDDAPALAADLGIADVVEFRPHSPRAELFRWYCVSDVVGVPSHNESFGLVALEAQACGRPVVATDVGGLRHAVDDGPPVCWCRVMTRPSGRRHSARSWTTPRVPVARCDRRGARGHLQLVQHGRLDLRAYASAQRAYARTEHP